MYRQVEAALVRATAYPDGLALPPFPEESGCVEADCGSWRRWIGQVWAIEAVVEAVGLASPGLAEQVGRIVAGGMESSRRVRRAAVSLHRYLVRWAHRSTPFGLFAGVAPARIGSRLEIRWGREHTAVAGADAVWLADVIRRLESFPELLGRLSVAADPTCVVRDGRLLIPCRRPARDEERGPGEIGIRHTRAVATVMSAAASSPVPVARLIGRLRAAYPSTPLPALSGLVAELVAHGFLLTSLRPAMTAVDGLGHVLGELAAAGAGSVPAVASLVHALREVEAGLAAHNTAAPMARRALRTCVAGRMQALTEVAGQPLRVDLRLDCSLTLPEAVAREAENAAGVLARLTPAPAGSRSWRDYHRRFLDRYGPGGTVPVIQLTAPVTGLGLPAGYRGSLAPRPAPEFTARDEQVLALAQRAALDGVREVVLTDEVVDALSAGAAGAPLPHIDLRFRIHARTPAALDRGDFTLVVTGLSPAAGATTGRFLALLDAVDRDRMQAAYQQLPTLTRGAVRAQVSSPPLNVRTENVSRSPALLPRVISVADYPSPAQVRLEDLAVTADPEGMYLIAGATGEVVEPALLNAVELAHQTHPLARLLCEVPRARAAAFGPFAWGAAQKLPFLPRIRHGRTVLAPATWRITACELPGPSASPAQWHQALMDLGRRLRLPAAVDAGDSDRRLRLRLDHAADAGLLRAELDRPGHATVREAPEESEYGWFGRAHDITLALASTRTPAPPPLRRAGNTVPVPRDHGHLPGASGWVFVKLYAPADLHPPILLEHLPRLWAGFGEQGEWWFVRFRDPSDHIRLRIRLSWPDGFGNAAASVGGWAADLRRRGLIGRVQFDTYYPETGRYGTGQTLSAAETVFAADSAAALTQLALTTGDRGSAVQAVVAAGLVDLTVSFTGDTATAMRWLTGHITTTAAPHPARSLHQEAMRLAVPGDGFAAVRALPGGERTVEAWAIRREALTAYRERLIGDGEDPRSVLSSLLHLHHLRTAGIDEAGEQTCFRLARSAALAWIASQKGTTR
ncbi:thiopeptide-type bacteriocin biosynthesis protein [Streptomyces albipurpureus]|uniref:Lantibiotic dehydratase n=1 Tax=Streptomyces albipurpureus TaxID=2897419 RepID=A0ABT0UZK7_9ACTN|nr:lantibiotic dehydratase [Streptomyces sp. CWNU-1]MCM2393899.1 lantibiotic dehydratase [Streptomyces sp. CWNU-1]